GIGRPCLPPPRPELPAPRRAADSSADPPYPGRMASPADEPSADLVTVPDLVGLPANVATDVARRCQLVAVGPSPEQPPNPRGTVLAQEPKAGSEAPRWSEVVLFTTP